MLKYRFKPEIMKRLDDGKMVILSTRRRRRKGGSPDDEPVDSRTFSFEDVDTRRRLVLVANDPMPDASGVLFYRDGIEEGEPPVQMDYMPGLEGAVLRDAEVYFTFPKKFGTVSHLLATMALEIPVEGGVARVTIVSPKDPGATTMGDGSDESPDEGEDAGQTGENEGGE